LACGGLGIIIDTSVFVCWCDGETGYGSLMDIVRSENQHIILCPTLKSEYLNQLHKRFVGAGKQVLESRIRKLTNEGILFETDGIPQNLVVIDRKDQHVMDCAMNSTHIVHIIVTDNKHDFVATLKQYRLPQLLAYCEYVDQTQRQTACAEAKRIMSEIEQRGKQARFL